MSNFSLTVLIEINGVLTRVGLKKSAGELEEKGFAQAGEIADKIVRRGIIHNENRNK